MAILVSYEFHLRRALVHALPPGRQLDPDIYAELASDREELERRLVAAEEQAAAAWSTCAALQKAIEQLREGAAEDIRRLDHTFAQKLADFIDRVVEELQELREMLP